MANSKSVDYIVTAKHYGGSARGYIRKQQQGIQRSRGVGVNIKDLDKEPTGAPVLARIWQGQWIADCECNGASFVDPDEPIFFCFSCGNRAHGSKPRPVTFPPTLERLEIERLLLERPVSDLAGLTDLERAGMAQAVLFVDVEEEVDEVEAMVMGSPIIRRKKVLRTRPLTRSWDPHESVEDLRRQQKPTIDAWKQELKEGKEVKEGRGRNGIQ